MSNTDHIPISKDPTAESRKSDHIQLAFSSRVGKSAIDQRFYYEPVLSGHPETEADLKFSFLGKVFGLPLWVSSMTGGTKYASTINTNLAKACGEYKMGMGLGSCRQLLYDDKHLEDFTVRKYIGDQPLYANLGIAQIEQLIASGNVSKIKELIQKLETDGLIIHINPMQEWLQPEGDRYYDSPLLTIKKLIDLLDIKLIIKEVGHGMGPASLLELFKLPIEAVDFAANGGTNFSLLELSRSNDEMKSLYEELSYIGHSAEEMVGYTNDLYANYADQFLCKQVIISGGISSFLEGYYLINKIALPAIYGQASAFLKPAMESYESLQRFIEHQLEGLKLAKKFLRVK